MNKRTIIILLVLVVLILAGLTMAFTLNQPLRTINTRAYFLAPEDWGGEFHVWFQGKIRETNTQTHAASGHWKVRIVNPEYGERELKMNVVCAAFSPDGNSAAVVMRVRQLKGWGQEDGMPGEYGYFWFKDGRQPGVTGDAFAINYYSFAPFKEYWPADNPPPCEYFDPGAYTLSIDSGYIKINP